MRVNRTLLYSGIFLVAMGAVVVAADIGGVRTEVLVDALRLWPLAIIAIGLGLVLRRTRVSLAGGMLAAAAPGLLLGGAFAVVPRVGDFCGLGDVAASAVTREGTFDGPASVSITTGCGALELRTAPGPGWRLDARHTDGRAPLVVGSARWQVPPGARLERGQEVLVGFRPEHVELSGGDQRDALRLPARVDVVEYLGNEELVHMQVDGAEFVALLSSEKNVRPGESADLVVPSEKLHLFDPETERRVDVA